MERKSISAHSVLGECVLNEYEVHYNTYIDHTHIGTIYDDSLLRVNETASIDKRQRKLCGESFAGVNLDAEARCKALLLFTHSEEVAEGSV